MTEPVRLALDTIQSILAPLEEADRTAVMIELAIVEAQKLAEVSKQLDEARETAEEWKIHNTQRLAETYEARALLSAWPNETLPMAILRWRCTAPKLTVEPVSPGWTARCRCLNCNGDNCENCFECCATHVEQK